MNVILISVDSLRADAISSQTTPYWQQLMNIGCFCDQTIVQAPFTIPSHASLLTGLYPFNHGLQRFDGQKLNPCAQTIFHFLAARGYATQALLDVNLLGKRYGFDDGFPRQSQSTTLTNIHQFIQQTSSPFFLFLHYWGVHTPYATFVPSRQGRDWLWNGRILWQWLTGQRVKSLLPGHPYWLTRLEKVRTMLRNGRSHTVQSGYKRAVQQMDRWLGQVYKLLCDNGLQQNTLLIITADHGECFNEHGEAEQFPTNYEHGLFLYENAIRVPTLLVGPGIVPAQHWRGQIESIDLLPTIYEQLGFPSQSDTGYLSLDGQPLSYLCQQPIFGKQFAYSETQRLGTYKRMLRTHQYKFIQDCQQDNEELYDLQIDPNEQNNLGHHKPPIVTELRESLAEFYKSHHQSGQATGSMTTTEINDIQARLHSLGYLP